MGDSDIRGRCLCHPGYRYRSSGLHLGVIAGIKKAGPRPAILQIAPGVGSPGEAERSTRAKIHFFFDFLAFFALAFFAFFAFLAIVSSQGFHGWKRDTEACLAEGQPRNILDDNPSRFAG
jgi:hypothetical protein